MSEQYRETIYWKEIIAILGILAVLFLGLSIRAYIDKPLDWQITFGIMLPMSILFVFLTINFRKLDIVITDKHLIVGFAYPKMIIPWSNIEDAKTDKESKPLILGFGIRMTRFEGEWVLVNNVIFARRAVVHLRKGKAKYFVFSTKNPELVAEKINANLNKGNPDGQFDD